MILAPSVTSLRVNKLAANFINIKWDSVGGNFFYVINRRQWLSGSYGQWQDVGVTSDTDWFDSSVAPSTIYQYRVQSTFNNFSPSEWVESDSLKTFQENAYLFTKMNQFAFSADFIQQKFVENNQRYITFGRDVIMAGLMDENFTFHSEYRNVSQVFDQFIVDPERHETQGDVPAICKDKERVMITEINGVLYLFERYQHVIKVSNDKGNNWVYYQAFNGRIGNPVARQCTYQSSTTTYVLGYNDIFFGRPSTDVRWSDNTNRFNPLSDITFAKLGDDNNVGFPVEIFGTYIGLPAMLNKRAESMATSDDYLYVGGRNVVFRTNLTTPAIGGDGKRKWDNDIGYNVTKDPENRSVIKKLDVLGTQLYALVSGRVKLNNDGSHMDPTVEENVEQSIYDGIYMFDDISGAWGRAFGDTEEERSHISHVDTNMSTDGDQVFFEYQEYQLEVFKDIELSLCDDRVNSAVRYSGKTSYPSDKKRHLITYRTRSDYFQAGPSAYHGESKFVWCKRSGTRSWITPLYKVVVVYPEHRYEYNIDPQFLLSSETWDKGVVTINVDDIEFKDFSSYSNGILLYKFNSEGQGGEIIGYYEFNYRVRDSAVIHWRPTQTLMTAELIQQEIDEEVTVDEPTNLIDPNISPLLNKMAPESYMMDGGLFKSFSDNYLQFISTGEHSYYNKLKNLIRNKYPREEDNFEYLYSEINRRNIYLDKEKRDLVVRFFESRSSDFYSTKGVVDSYKFLFRLLYNQDVDIEVESMNSLEYDIVVESGLVTEDIVGTTIYTPTGRANVTYIEREYKDGKLQWRITLHNLIGKFIEGQVLKSEIYSKFTAKILIGVRGKELTHSDIDYINRGRVYYTMKIKSEIPLTRYKNDVLRFVHPVGFGFMGITLLSVLIHSGLSLVHKETIINVLKCYRWDAGLSLKFPKETNKLDANGNVVFDEFITGKVIKEAHPLAGLDPMVVLPDVWGDYDNMEPSVGGVKASDRRRELSPTFDAAWLMYVYYSVLEGRRLKDHVGLPRESDKLVNNPTPATQIKVGKCQQSTDL